MDSWNCAVKKQAITYQYWTSHTTLFIFMACLTRDWKVNTLRSRQNGPNFADNISNCIYFSKKIFIFWPCNLFSRVQLKRSILIPIMAWHSTGNKALSEPVMVLFTEAYTVSRCWLPRRSKPAPKIPIRDPHSIETAMCKLGDFLVCRQILLPNVNTHLVISREVTERECTVINRTLVLISGELRVEMSSYRNSFCTFTNSNDLKCTYIKKASRLRRRKRRVT